MRFSAVAAASAALVAGAQAGAYNYSSPAYVTEVVTAYTTYCPGPTEISHSGVTYTVTEATTLTITNCPCTITKPVTSAVVTTCTTCSTPAPYSPPAVSSSPVAPVYSSSSPAPYGNATTPVVVPSSTGSVGTATTSAYATFTGAANKAFAASGAGLAAVFGLAAYVL